MHQHHNSLKKFIFVLSLCLLSFCSYAIADTITPSTIVQYLRMHTEAEMAADNPGFLDVVFGEAPFTFEHDGQTIDLASTGLADATPYIRQESCRIISELGTMACIPKLLTKLSQEQEPGIQEEIYRTVVKLRFAAASDTQVFTQAFLNQYPASEYLSITRRPPLAAFYFVLEKIRDAGWNMISQLELLKTQCFQTDPVTSAQIDDTIAIIQLQQSSSGQALYEQALASSNSAILNWGLTSLSQVKTPLLQAYCNNILDKFWLTQNSLMLSLLQEMQKNHVLRSDNANPCFEFSSASNIQDWTITTQDNPNTTVSLSTNKPYSYTRSLKVFNKSNTTKLTNTMLNFTGKLPTTLEYGFSYCIGTHGNDIAMVEDQTNATLTAHITFNEDNSTITKTLTSNEPMLQWRSIADKFIPSDTDPNPKHIKSVQIEITLTGNDAEWYIDDAFARRPLGEGENLSQPQINSININPQMVFLYPVSRPGGDTEQSELISLTANVTTSDPGDTITGNWSSSLQGDLANGLTAQARLNRAGKHQISFRATNSFGLIQEASATVDVFRPVVSFSLTTAVDPTDIAQPVSEDVGFNVAVTRDPPLDNAGTPDFSLPTPFTYSGKLYTDYDREIGTIIAGTPCVVDTRRLPNGMNTFYAKVNVYRSGAASSLLPFESGNIVLNVQQPPQSTLGVRLSSPTYGSQLTGITPICAEIENTSAAVLTRVVFTMQNEQGGAVYTLRTVTAAPYACNLNPQQYQQFPQTTTYLLFATAYFNLGGGSVIDVRSQPVWVTIPAVMPPTNLTAVAANGNIQLRWQDNSNNEKEFCLYCKSGTGTYVIVARRPANSIAYLDGAAIIPGTQYYYKVSAFTSNNIDSTLMEAAKKSLSSNKAMAVTAKAILPPNNTITAEEFSNEAIVTALLNSPNTLLISQASGDGVQLGWTLPTDRRGITNIVVERKLNLPGEGFTEIGKVGGGATSFLDQSIAKSSYCYRVRAVNTLISSVASNEVSVTLDFPNAPLNLTATRAGTIINLNWTDLSKDETGFVILRSVGTNTNFTLRASLPVNATSFQDSGTLPSTSYYYRVRANKNGQWSASKTEVALLAPVERVKDNNPLKY